MNILKIEDIDENTMNNYLRSRIDMIYDSEKLIQPKELKSKKNTKTSTHQHFDAKSFFMQLQKLYNEVIEEPKYSFELSNLPKSPLKEGSIIFFPFTKILDSLKISSIESYFSQKVDEIKESTDIEGYWIFVFFMEKDKMFDLSKYKNISFIKIEGTLFYSRLTEREDREFQKAQENYKKWISEIDQHLSTFKHEENKKNL